MTRNALSFVAGALAVLLVLRGQAVLESTPTPPPPSPPSLRLVHGGLSALASDDTYRVLHHNRVSRLRSA